MTAGGKGVVEQHVPAEVPMNELVRKIDRSQASKQRLRRLRKIGVLLAPGHLVSPRPAMRRSHRGRPANVRDRPLKLG